MKYQIIRKRNGKYYPSMTGPTGLTFGAWNGYRGSYDEALDDIKERIARDEGEKQQEDEEVVYEVVV